MSNQSNPHLDLLSDFGFKHVFGREVNKDILIDFLNALFQGRKIIIDLIYGPTERAGESKIFKKVFFDLMCTGNDGEQFIIEIQRKSQRYFRDRSVYYTSKLIAEQLPSGNHNWKVPLKESFLIAVLDFILPDNEDESYLHQISMVNTDSGKLFYNKIQYIFIELPKFAKEEIELLSELDKWLYLLKNLQTFDVLPNFLNSSIFQKVFNITDISKLTKEERMAIDWNLKHEMDYVATIRFAAEEAAAETRLNERRALVHKLESGGIPAEQILQILGITREELEAPFVPTPI